MGDSRRSPCVCTCGTRRCFTGWSSDFGGRLYGPYHHGGRDYYQWMARGEYLRAGLIPLLERHLRPELDGHAWTRFASMRERYRV